MNEPTASGSSGFDLNKPTIISLLYLSSFFLGITGFVGLILSFIWKDEPETQPWEVTHYTYLINTFWIGLAGTIVGVILMIVLIGFFVLLATLALVAVRSVMSLINAQKRAPMPNPGSWTI